MKAIKVIEPFKVEIVDVPKPVVEKEDDVIVKITSGGICGSDIGIWNGTNSLATYPRLIGHEFGGVVESVGSAVTHVKPGDQVAVDPVISCGHCYVCTHGRHNVCGTLEVMGVHRDGGFAEFVKAPSANVYKFNKEMNPAYLGLVEPYTIGVEVNSRAQIGEGDQVLIMGSGPIGICAMQVAKKRGAQVIMTDLVDSRLEKALSMGADVVVNPQKEDLEAKLLEFTNGEGIPVIVDTVCIPASFEQAVQLACPAGRIVILGLKNVPSNICMADITKKELTIVGSRLNNYCFPEVIEGFEAGTLHPEDLMTKVFSYKDIEKAFATIKEAPEKVLKIVLSFEE